nr:hypothetical protein [Tanacetum cinerariifolium]
MLSISQKQISLPMLLRSTYRGIERKDPGPEQVGLGYKATRALDSSISLEREASRACCRGDPVTFMNVKEWGIFLVTVPMFRWTNAAGGVQNRPAEDERVHVVEPRAREALKVSESRKHCGGSEA